MGCLQKNYLEIIQFAPFGDPIYINVNIGSHFAIIKQTAHEIEVEIREK